MTQKKDLKNIAQGDEFLGTLLVKDASVRSTRQNKPYLRLTLTDGEQRSIVSNYWDYDPENNICEAGALLRIAGSVESFNGALQLKIRSVRKEDPSKLGGFVASAPESPEAMFREIEAAASAIGDSQIRRVVCDILARRREQILSLPAAKTIHHDVIGGLLWHTLGMLRSAKALAPVYPFLNTDLLYAGVILHDLAKVEEMVQGPSGLVTDYSFEGQLKGHLALGSEDVRETCRRLGVDREREVLLTHMILSHHGSPEQGSVKVPAFPEAAMLHLLDMIDSRMIGMNRDLRDVEPGNFTERGSILASGARLYKPALEPEEPGNRQTSWV